MQQAHTLKNLHRAGTFPNPNDWIWYPGRQVNFRKLMRIHPSEREAAVKLVVQPVGNLQLKDMWLCRAILWLLSVVFFKIKKKCEPVKLYTLNFFQMPHAQWRTYHVKCRNEMQDEMQKSVTWFEEISWAWFWSVHRRWNWVLRLRQTISERSHDTPSSSFRWVYHILKKL